MLSESKQTDSLSDYVDSELFKGEIGSLDTHLRRKEVISHPCAYSILYIIWEKKEIRRPDLKRVSELEEDKFENVINCLIDVNLIARVPAPEGPRGERTYYKITFIGKQEIESDRKHILG